MLEKIKLVHSPLTDKIMMIRHGVDPCLALEKREAEKDVMVVLVEFMMHQAPEGANIDVTIGENVYTVTVKPKKTA